MNNHGGSLLFALNKNKNVSQIITIILFHSENNCPMCGKEEDTLDHCINFVITYPEGTRTFNIVY